MALRDSYKTAASPGSPAAATVLPAPSTVPGSREAPSVASSSSGVAATPATISPTPARRDLTALRQRLAGGNGGVNPPEAVAAIMEEIFEPTTRETADGGAEPLPNHPDAAKVAAPSTVAPAASVAPAKRKRRTKAEMEAARAAEAASVPSPETAPSTVVGAESPVALAHGIGTPDYTRELAAVVAETQGLVILTDALRHDLNNEAVEIYLRNLSLQGAIELVRERMFVGMKALEIEK